MFAGVFAENFLVQAAVRGEPGLRECALALVDGAPPLTKVVAVSEAARRVGVAIGMPKATAAQFVGVEIRARSLALEKSAHAALLDLGWSISPRIEDTSADTMVVDVAGLGSIFGDEEAIADELLERGRACGLQLNVAVAANIGTALVAARGIAGACVIVRGEEADDIEQWLNREFESPAKEPFQKVLADKELTGGDWEILVRFLASQIVRTPAFLIKSHAGIRWRPRC